MKKRYVCRRLLWNVVRRGCESHHLHILNCCNCERSALLLAFRNCTELRIQTDSFQFSTVSSIRSLTSTVISKKKKFRKNSEIRADELRLIDHEGTQRGVVSTSEAMAIAQQAGMDLVEVSPLANPPVAKIMDFGRLQYEQDRQQRKAKSLSKKAGELKGIRLSVTIGEHDMAVRVKNGQKFLDKGHKLKIELQLRGRQKAHPELAKETIERYIELLERDTVVEQPVKRQGGRFSSIVSLKKK